MSKEYNLRGNRVVADSFVSLDGLVLDVQAVEDAIADKTEVAALVALTDNSGGTANDTIAVIADIALSTSDTYTDAAVNAAVNTALGAIKNDVADLAAKVNAIIAALKA